MTSATSASGEMSSKVSERLIVQVNEALGLSLIFQALSPHPFLCYKTHFILFFPISDSFS